MTTSEDAKTQVSEQTLLNVGFGIKRFLERHLHDGSLGAFKALLVHVMSDPLLREAPGSSHNHQAWPGGYLDHVHECMRLAVRLYPVLTDMHVSGLPFTLPSALSVLFLHDIEKPWRHAARVLMDRANAQGTAVNLSLEHQFARGDKTMRAMCRLNLMERFGIVLTPEEMNALKYVEGENDDYTPTKRVMNELAAFCHLCDVTSARIFHDQPQKDRIER